MEENEVKKGFNFKKFIIIVLIVLAIIIGSLFGVYKCCIDISQKNLEKFDYLTDWDYDIEAISDTVGKDFAYISENSVLRLDFPKTLLYEKILNFNDFNDSLNEKYNLNVDQFGFNIDETDSHLIHFYADVTYNEKIGAFINGTIKLVINSNDVAFYFDSVQVGSLPASWISSFLPIKSGDLIYQLKTQNLLSTIIPDLKDEDAKWIDESIIDLTYFENLHSDVENIGIDFKLVNYVSKLVSQMFGDEYGEYVDLLMPTIIDEIVKALTDESEQKYGTN